MKKSEVPSIEVPNNIKTKEDLQKFFNDYVNSEADKILAKNNESDYYINLHEKVNKEQETDFKNVDQLIKKLAEFAKPALKNKILTVKKREKKVGISS